MNSIKQSLSAVVCCLLFSAAFAATPQNKPKDANQNSGKTLSVDQKAALEQAKKLLKEKDYQGAYTITIPIAKAGNPDAMYLVSSIFIAVRDVKQHMEWLQKAADKKQPAALRMLGKYSMDKNSADVFGVTYDVDRGVKIIFDAEKLGSTEAMLDIAWFHSEGTGMPVDKKQALQWYDKYERVTGEVSQDRKDFIRTDEETRVGREVCLAEGTNIYNFKPILKVKFSNGQDATLQIVGTIVARSDSYSDVSLLIKSIKATTANGETSRLDSFSNPTQNEKFTVGKEAWVSKYITMSCD